MSTAEYLLGLCVFVFIIGLRTAISFHRRTYMGRLSERLAGGMTPAEEPERRPSFMEQVDAQIAMTNFRLRAKEFVLLAIVIGIVSLLTVNAVFRSPTIGVLAGMAAGILIPRQLLKIGMARKRAEAETQLEQVLRDMGTNLAGGKNVYNTIVDVAKNMPDPLGPAFRQAVFDMTNKNVSPEEAMLTVGRSVDSDVFQLFVRALRFQRKYGSKLTDVLNDLADEIKSQRDYQRDIRQETAQANLSVRVISLMPIGFFAVMQLANPSYYHGYLGTTGGRITVLISMGMSYLGYVLAKRMCKIG